MLTGLAELWKLPVGHWHGQGVLGGGGSSCLAGCLCWPRGVSGGPPRAQNPQWEMAKSFHLSSLGSAFCCLPPPPKKKKNPQKTYTKLLFGETSIRNPCFFPYHHPLFYLLNPNPSPLGSVSVHLLFKPEMNQVKNSIGPSGKATEYFGGYYYH